MIGVTVAVLVGGAVSAPFVSAAEQPGGRASDRSADFWSRIGQWYGFGSGTAPGTPATPSPSVTPGAGATPSTGTGTWPGLGGGSWPGFDGGGGGGAGDGACSDVELVFARGTGELQGLGIVGTPLASALKSALPGKSVESYAVQYAADVSQASAGPGASDMSAHVSSVAESCPDTTFVIGGYSQGATVTDIAIGISGAGMATGGDSIPAGIAPRVAAVVVFGNPLGLTRRSIAESSQTYGPKAKEFCNDGDPVCGAGANIAAHLSYAIDGSATEAAQFAAGKINGS